MRALVIYELENGNSRYLRALGARVADEGEVGDVPVLGRVDILNLLIHLKQSGLAILFITHDLSLGNYVSDRTVILRHGAVVEMGDTVKVFTNPRHPYTQNLLAAAPELHKKWAATPDHGPAEPVTALRAVGPEPPLLAEYEPGHLVAGTEL